MTATSAAAATVAAKLPAGPSLLLAPPGVRLPAARVSFASLLREETKHETPAGHEDVATPRMTPQKSAPLAQHGLLPQNHAQSERSDGARPPSGRRDSDDPLDPLTRHRAALAPPESVAGVPHHVLIAESPHPLAPPPAQISASRAIASLEDLVPALVRRVAWSGDGRRGTMRLELGSGELSGATLLVHADGGHVRVQLDVPTGVNAQGWKERIAERLASRGIAADSIEVE